MPRPIIGSRWVSKDKRKAGKIVEVLWFTGSGPSTRVGARDVLTFRVSETCLRNWERRYRPVEVTPVAKAA